MGNFTLRSQSAIGAAGPGDVALRFFTSPEGGDYEVFEFDPAQDPVASIGACEAADVISQHGRITGKGSLGMRLPLATAGSIGSVSQSGTGPTVTAAAADAGVGALESLSIKVKVTVGGVLGTSQIAIAYDGATYAEETETPQETPATLIGTVDMTSSAVLSAIPTTTLITTDIVSSVTFGAGPFATAQAVVDDLNAAYAAGPVALVADLYQGKYLRIRSTGVGTSVTFEVDALSTADTILGISGSATGGAAELELASTGVVLTFAAGTYVLDTTYSLATAAPRFSLASLQTGLATAKSNGLSFTYIHIVQEPTTASEMRAWCDAIDTIVGSWLTALPRFCTYYVIGAPLSAADADLRDEFDTYESRYAARCVGSVYTKHSSIPGLFARSSSRPLAWRRALLSLSADPGDGTAGGLEECVIKGPDGSYVRRENVATIKLNKKGWNTIQADYAGRPVFTRGRTAAPFADIFRDIAIFAVGCLAFNVITAAAELKKNTKLRPTSDGKIADVDRQLLESYYTDALDVALLDAEDQHAAAVLVAVNPVPLPSGTGGAGKLIRVTYQVQTLIQAEDTQGDIVITETIAVPAGG